ncbi:MAG: protoglobin domain-containing protein, partial [Candidatus Poribacteria bacterium]
MTDDHGGSYAPQRGNAEREDNRGHQSGTIRAALARRLEYLSFGQADADLLHSLQPVIQQHSDDIVRAFYEHLIAFETTRNLLHDEATMNRLVEAQKRHVVELFGGVYDERYAERRLLVGKTHDRVGLEPSWYLGSYHLYQRVLFPIVTEYLAEGGASQGEVTEALLAITKVMTLDIDLALESYFGAYSDALRQ